MKLELMEDLYIEELKDLYDAEKQLLKALPEMAKAASAEELRQALESHVQQTEGQVNRLEQVFGDLGESGRGRRCKAMAGLIEEAQDFLEEDAEPEIKDAGLITNAQKIEHYEIAGYGSACAHAKLLGLADQVGLLDQTLAEEEETDEKLNLVAERINREAAEGEITSSADGR
ncbi:MAG: ferritin-like protein [Pedosphaera sp.]|nr:ferritin-like protein [Pedosphaera sp.]